MAPWALGVVPRTGLPGSRGQRLPRPGHRGHGGGTGRASGAPLHSFTDISLDVDTHRTGKVKRSHGDKVKLSWLPQGGRVDRQSWG